MMERINKKDSNRKKRRGWRKKIQEKRKNIYGHRKKCLKSVQYCMCVLYIEETLGGKPLLYVLWRSDYFSSISLLKCLVMFVPPPPPLPPPRSSSQARPPTLLRSSLHQHALLKPPGPLKGTEAWDDSIKSNMANWDFAFLLLIFGCKFLLKRWIF